MTEETRSPIEPTEMGFNADGLGEVSPDEMERIIQATPKHISPNVVLRPLYQDLLLPTIAYVAGPGETSYFGQLKGAYDWAGIPMPIIYPRVSVSLVESNIARLLEAESIRIEQIDTDVERMFTDLVKEAISSEVEDELALVRSALSDHIKGLATHVREIDPTLEKSTLAISSTIEKEIGRLQSKIVRSQKQKNETTRNRLSKIVGNLFPDGVPQERSIAAAYFLARYGTGLLDDLLNELPLDTSAHIAFKL